MTASLLQRRTGRSWCSLVKTGGREGGGYQREDLWGPEGEGDRETGRKWRTCGWEERQRSQREKARMWVLWKGGKKKMRKTAKEIQSSLTFTVHSPPTQGCARLWLMGCKRAWKSTYLEWNRIFLIIFFWWIIPACLQDTTDPSELAFQASHLKWCIRNVTSL